MKTKERNHGSYIDHPPQSLITDQIVIDLDGVKTGDNNSSIRTVLSGKLCVFRIPGFTGFSLVGFGLSIEMINSGTTGVAGVVHTFSDSKISSDSSVYPENTMANLGIAFSRLGRGVSDGLRNTVFEMSIEIRNKLIFLNVDIHPVYQTNTVDSSDFITDFTSTDLVPDLE